MFQFTDGTALRMWYTGRDLVYNNLFSNVDYSTQGDATNEGAAGGLRTADSHWLENTFDTTGRAQAIRGGIGGNRFEKMLFK